MVVSTPTKRISTQEIYMSPFPNQGFRTSVSTGLVEPGTRDLSQACDPECQCRSHKKRQNFVERIGGLSHDRGVLPCTHKAYKNGCAGDSEGLSQCPAPWKEMLEPRLSEMLAFEDAKAKASHG